MEACGGNDQAEDKADPDAYSPHAEREHTEDSNRQSDKHIGHESINHRHLDIGDAAQHSSPDRLQPVGILEQARHEDKR